MGELLCSLRRTSLMQNTVLGDAFLAFSCHGEGLFFVLSKNDNWWFGILWVNP